MRKFFIFLGIVLIGLFVVGCDTRITGPFGNDSNGSTDKRTTIAMQWYSTERGDVRCTDHALPYSMEQHDCDWSTLGKRPEGIEVDGGLPSQWIRTDDGEVWCVNNPISHQGVTTDCDWSTLNKRVNSGRLPTFEDTSK